MTGLMSFPTRILHGRGAIRELPAELRRAGASARVFLITEAAVLRANLLRLVAPQLEQSGLALAVWPEAEALPSEASARAALSAFRASGAEALLAVGSGGAIDLAKAVRLLHADEQPLSTHAAEAARPGAAPALAHRGSLLPLVAVPTTAGAGTEATDRAALLVEGVRTTLSDCRLLPCAALLDAELTSASPPLNSAIDGMDALACALEAWLAKGEHPIADALALEAVRRIGGSLRAAVKSPRDLAAREQLLLGACLAGISAERGQGPVRAIAHALAELSGTPVGLGCALLLPGVLAFDRMAAEARVAQASVALGFDPRAGAAEQGAAAPQLVEELRAGCGLPRKLSQAGVKRDLQPLLVERALAEPSCGQGPRACGEVDLERLTGEAY